MTGFSAPRTKSSGLASPRFPDYKSSFPKWKRQDTAALVPGLEEAGLDLLDGLLEYDPARRLSAKQACMHPYFQHGSSYYSGRNRRNGLH